MGHLRRIVERNEPRLSGGGVAFGNGAGSTALTQTNLHFKRLTFAEALAYLVGTNVGAAILSLPYAARQAGYGGDWAPFTSGFYSW